MNGFLVIARCTLDHIPLGLFDSLAAAEEFAAKIDDQSIIESQGRAVVLGDLMPSWSRWVGVIEFVGSRPVRLVSRRLIDS